MSNTDTDIRGPTSVSSSASLDTKAMLSPVAQFLHAGDTLMTCTRDFLLLKRHYKRTRNQGIVILQLDVLILHGLN